MLKASALLASHAVSQVEAQGVFQRIAADHRSHRDKVRHIQSKHIVLQSGTEGDIFTVALHCSLVEVTGTHGEEVVVPILDANANIDLAQFLIESADMVILQCTLVP